MKLSKKNYLFCRKNVEDMDTMVTCVTIASIDVKHWHQGTDFKPWYQ